MRVSADRSMIGGRTMENSTSDDDLKNKFDFSKCRIIEIANGEIMECQVEQSSCRYILHFGDTIYCQHPSRKEITKLNRIKKDS